MVLWAAKATVEGGRSADTFWQSGEVMVTFLLAVEGAVEGEGQLYWRRGGGGGRGRGGGGRWVVQGRAGRGGGGKVGVVG